MDLIISHPAEIALNTLGEDDRRKIHAWFDHLRNWETDQFVQSKSRKLDLAGDESVYVLRTSTDLRLFFILGSDRIEVIDIARRDSLERVGQASVRAHS